MYFTPAIIDQYLQDCGVQVMSSKTANRSVVAGLNTNFLTVKTTVGSDYLYIYKKFSSDIE